MLCLSSLVMWKEPRIFFPSLCLSHRDNVGMPRAFPSSLFSSVLTYHGLYNSFKKDMLCDGCSALCHKHSSQLSKDPTDFIAVWHYRKSNISEREVTLLHGLCCIVYRQILSSVLKWGLVGPFTCCCKYIFIGTPLWLLISTLSVRASVARSSENTTKSMSP